MKIEVFYIGGSTGWVTAKFDENGYQVGPAVYHWHKVDAVAFGSQAARGLSCELHIFTRHATLGNVINYSAGKIAC